jgi:transcriptional regulator with XRE-family HTH domain
MANQPTIETRKSLRTANGRRSRATLQTLMVDIDRLRRDGGMSIRTLAEGSKVSPGYLCQLLAGDREPSIAVLTAIATTLGADLSMRLYPTTGPSVRDRSQVRIVEALLGVLDARWRPSTEVDVRRPARGFIDLVLDSMADKVVVAGEIQSRIDRVEQMIRWARDKAASLPSSGMWHELDGERTVSRLLVVRSTVATRTIARQAHGTLAAAYPARSRDVYGALTGATAGWPGAGILWADVSGDGVRILERPPRGVELGR